MAVQAWRCTEGTDWQPWMCPDLSGLNFSWVTLTSFYISSESWNSLFLSLETWKKILTCLSIKARQDGALFSWKMSLPMARGVELDEL